MTATSESVTAIRSELRTAIDGTGALPGSFASTVNGLCRIIDALAATVEILAGELAALQRTVASRTDHLA